MKGYTAKLGYNTGFGILTIFSGENENEKMQFSHHSTLMNCEAADNFVI